MRIGRLGCRRPAEWPVLAVQPAANRAAAVTATVMSTPIATFSITHKRPRQVTTRRQLGPPGAWSALPDFRQVKPGELDQSRPGAYTTAHIATHDHRASRTGVPFSPVGSQHGVVIGAPWAW